MARWQHIQQALDIKVYFCDPHSWQRPTNEQTSGMLRRWLPQGTDLIIGAVRLAVIEDHLNAMPHKLAPRSLRECRERSVPLGKYWRSRPLVFSLVPRCQGLWGSQK